MAVLCGVHKGPITEFEWSNSLVASAGKDGLLALWDINTQKCISKQNAHAGQVGKILFHSDGMDNNLIISAGLNDASISCIDMRTHNRVFYKRVF
jgi:WD40 repeat protein